MSTEPSNETVISGIHDAPSYSIRNFRKIHVDGHGEGGKPERETNDARPHTTLKSVHELSAITAPSTPHGKIRQWCQRLPRKLYYVLLHAYGETELLMA